MMKQLALLAFACIAFTYEAAAEDSHIVRKRALMVKTIQTYAQIDIGYSQNKAISARVLAAMGQDAQTPRTYKLAPPPPCTNNKGETVRFIDSSSGRPGLAAGMADRDSSGKPVVLRSNYSATPPEFQSFIDRHECAHHQTGDIDRPHPPRNGPEHLMNESISDCVAILRLRDEEKYDRAAINAVTAAMRNDMAKIGFPETSIASRISNIDNCFARRGSARDLINKILKKRGLL